MNTKENIVPTYLGDKMSGNKLDEFRNVINKINDVETLESGQGLLRDMMRISALKKEISSLEEGLTDGGRAMFYYFAMALDEEEFPYVAEKIGGRMNRLSLKKKREDKMAEKLNDDAPEAEEDNV